MNFILIPIAVFLAIVALLILKEISHETFAKKLLKVFIILLFVLAFGIIAYFMNK